MVRGLPSRYTVACFYSTPCLINNIVRLPHSSVTHRPITTVIFQLVFLGFLSFRQSFSLVVTAYNNCFSIHVIVCDFDLVNYNGFTFISKSNNSKKARCQLRGALVGCITDEKRKGRSMRWCGVGDDGLHIHRSKSLTEIKKKETNTQMCVFRSV